MKRIGLFGGTFSPPHIGHIHAARAFLAEEKPDTLLIMPTYLPPHKTLSGDATPEQRLEMCRIAFAFDTRIQVSDLEIARGGKSYTVDTLEAIKTEENELSFLCGTDMFLTLTEWREPRRIFALSDIVCMERENDPALHRAVLEKKKMYEDAFGARIRLLSVPPLPMSATECREAARLSELDSRYIPEEVRAYIQKWNLYR